MESKVTSKVLTLVWKLFDGLIALCTYSMGAYFNFELFSQQGGKDSTLAGVYGALGVVFDMMKVTFTAEGMLRRKASILILAMGFSAISLTSSALNMLGSWTAAVEVQENDPLEVQRAGYRDKIKSLQEQISSEQARLSAGSVVYRTDALETRKSIAALQAEVDSTTALLAALPVRTIRESQAAQGFFGSIPVGKKTQDWLNLIFRFLITVFLELGGWASIYLLVRGGRGGMGGRTLELIPPVDSFTLDKKGTVHMISSLRGGVAHTLCGRAFANVEVDWGKNPVVCVECTRRRSTHVQG